MALGRKNDFFSRAEKDLEKEAAKQTAEGGGASGGPVATVTTQPPVVAQQTTAPVQSQTTQPAPTTQAPVQNITTQAPVTQQQTTAPVVQNQTTQPPAAPETEEQIARRYLASKGITMDVDELVSKVTTKDLTPEEKAKAETRRRQRVLDRFVEGGGTMDEFFGIENLKNIPDVDLVKADFYNQAKTVNPDLDDQELEDLFAKQYFIGRKPGEYTEAEVKIGQAGIKRIAESIRSKKAEPISKIDKELQAADEAIQSNKQWQQRVEQFGASMPRKIVFNIGKMGDKQTDLGDFEYELSEQEHKDFVNDLKDPAFLVNAIKDETGKGTDLNKLSQLLLKARILDKVVKASSYQAFSKGIETVSGTLNNFPDLRNMGGTQGAQTENQTERQQGEKALVDDSKQILGSSRGNRRKSFLNRS